MPITHSVRLRVRFAETDALKIAHHTAYFVWFEVARTELLRSVGLPYTEIRRKGFDTPLVEAFANYMAPAKYEDEVEVKIWPSKLGRSSIRLEYRVTKVRGGSVLCLGHTVHVFVGSDDGKPKKIPEDLRRALGKASTRDGGLE